MPDLLADPRTWASLLTLSALEIVLGIDNIVFISLMAGRLPRHRQARARRVGLVLALFSRLALLASIAWIVTLNRPLFEVAGLPVSIRDLILIAGGLFLIGKGTTEIHHSLEGEGEEGAAAPAAAAGFVSIVVQIMLLDIVFSLDSVITAVGMARDLPIMAAAVTVADGLGFHIPKGYLYFAIAFSVMVEMLNLTAARRRRAKRRQAGISR